MVTKIITDYLHSDKDSMYELGAEIGLKEDALRIFVYALYEVEVTMEVDMETGRAKAIKFEEIQGTG